MFIKTALALALVVGTAAGAVARISERIIDCPAKVIVIGASCGRSE